MVVWWDRMLVLGSDLKRVSGKQVWQMYLWYEFHMDAYIPWQVITVYLKTSNVRFGMFIMGNVYLALYCHGSSNVMWCFRATYWQ